jgi:exoribonuclease R
VLRTLPPPADQTVQDLRLQAKALGVTWPEGTSYGDLIRSLDLRENGAAAFVVQAAKLFRGAGYLAFGTDGGPAPAGDAAVHAAVAAPYAHVTAPLRRLVDRFGNEVVLALCAGRTVPDWVQAALPLLPEVMAETTRRASAADGMARDLVEGSVLAGCQGATLEGLVIKTHDKGAVVQVRDPAVIAPVDARGVAVGDEIRLAVGADGTLVPWPASAT